MPSKSPSGEPGPEALRAAVLCAVIERDYDRFHQGIVVLVMRDGALRHPHQVEEAVQELIAETVGQALAHAANFDPSRSGLAWLFGIAARLLLSRRRAAARDRRQVAHSDLGEEAWQAVLEQLCSAPGKATEDSFDVRQALERLDGPARHALELRYFQGLDRDDLARALGVSTAGAARVRVCRALQALRALFLAEDSGDKP